MSMFRWHGYGCHHEQDDDIYHYPATGCRRCGKGNECPIVSNLITSSWVSVCLSVCHFDRSIYLLHQLLLQLQLLLNCSHPVPMDEPICYTFILLLFHTVDYQYIIIWPYNTCIIIIITNTMHHHHHYYFHTYSV